MSQQQIIKKLKTEAKKMPLRQLAKSIGVKNHTTLFYWLKDGTMSVQNLERVEKYFAKKEKKKGLKNDRNKRSSKH